MVGGRTFGDDIRGLPERGGGLDHLDARRLVGGIGKARGLARAGLDHAVITEFLKLERAVGGHRHPWLRPARSPSEPRIFTVIPSLTWRRPMPHSNTLPGPQLGSARHFIAHAMALLFVIVAPLPLRHAAPLSMRA